MTETEKTLMEELLQLALTSNPYIRGDQWAVNAVLTAKALLKN
jgi:hypothetical protein